LPQVLLFSPGVSVGGGYARFHESAKRQDGAPNTGRIGANKAAAQFGGGLDFGTPLRILFPINLRVEVRDIYSGKPITTGIPVEGFQHNVLFSEVF